MRNTARITARFLTSAAAAVAVVLAAIGAIAQDPPAAIAYRLEERPKGTPDLTKSFSDEQIAVLEKLNRADRRYLPRLPALVLPDRFDLDELAYSPLPAQRPESEGEAKFLLVDLRMQAFGAYENGRLVRWGPVNTGRKSSPTPAGSYHLNWRSAGRHSTVNPEWYMKWYFNFGNRRGLSFHAYALPGYPASHACVRMLNRDARWLYEWGEGWTLDAKQTSVLRAGTPVSIVGEYDYDAPPPWRQVATAPEQAPSNTPQASPPP